MFERERERKGESKSGAIMQMRKLKIEFPLARLGPIPLIFPDLSITITILNCIQTCTCLQLFEIGDLLLISMSYVI